MNNVNELLMVTIGILLTALVGGCGYFFKLIIEQIHRITYRLDRIDERLDGLTRDMADIKPKVNALWDHFVKHNLS